MPATAAKRITTKTTYYISRRVTFFSDMRVPRGSDLMASPCLDGTQCDFSMGTMVCRVWMDTDSAPKQYLMACVGPSGEFWYAYVDADDLLTRDEAIAAGIGS